MTCHETSNHEVTFATESADVSASASEEHFLTAPPIAREYLVPENAGPLGGHAYPHNVDTRGAKLLSLFLKPPVPELPDGTIIQVAPTLQGSLQRVRQVAYERGTSLDEATLMRAFVERLHSFDDCVHLHHK